MQSLTWVKKCTNSILNFCCNLSAKYICAYHISMWCTHTYKTLTFPETIFLPPLPPFVILQLVWCILGSFLVPTWCKMLLIHESLGTLQKVEGTIKAILLKHGIDTVFELKCFDQSELRVSRSFVNYINILKRMLE